VPANSLVVGDVQISALTDATVDYPWPLAELFPGVPEEAWEPFRERYPAAFGGRDVWRSWFRCFLVRSQGMTVLLDTGMGPKGSPLADAFRSAGRLPDELRAAGASPEHVDVVVLSHLHPDHVGGAVLADGGDLRLAFPRARYLASETDWNAFHRPEVQAHFPFPFVERNISPIEALGALELVAGDHALTSEVTLRPAPGHTPGHMTVDVQSGGERAVLAVDALLHPAQVTEPDWSSMFDMDRDEERRTRHRLLDELEARDLIFAASHFPDPCFGRVVRTKDGRHWAPI
jgi:glyoxylase-like metal-dependent hydrolase (beta-lactamase superfamily II)